MRPVSYAIELQYINMANNGFKETQGLWRDLHV